MMSVQQTNPIEPVMDDFSRIWFDAAAEGRLLIQKSPSTGEHFFYPRWRTPGNLAEEPVWVEASGKGSVYSFSVVHWNANAEFLDDCPYVFAVVKLDEGPHMTTRIVDVDPDEVRCDMPVEVVFRTVGGETVLPVFKPAERREA